MKSMLGGDPRKIIEKTRNDYNLIAKEWDLSRTRPSQLKLDLIREVDSNMVVLDVGCGNGFMFPYVCEKGAFYTGLDISENLIGIARKKYSRSIEAGRAGFVVGEATDLPFQDDEFDFIFSFAVLHHIPSVQLRKIFFEEIRRVLRPNGKVRITVWNLYNEWARSRFDVGAQLAGNASGDVVVPWKGTRGEFINRYVHQFSRDELASLAQSAQFSDIEIDYFNRKGEKVENGEEIVMKIRKSM